ncbi:hypothetical protein OSTOST_12802, partial [Ostertagia ostertagi]
MDTKTKVLLGIVGAAAAGVVIGLLIAPEKGTETRKKIVKTAGGWVDSLGQLWTKGKDMAGDVAQQAKDKDTGKTIMQKKNAKKSIRPPQHQSRPGSERSMKPQPIFDYPNVPGRGRLKNRVALITGGDSGIGKAVAILFAKEGADIAISYLNEHRDAKDTKRIIEEQYGRKCVLLPGDIGKEKHCKL